MGLPDLLVRDTVDPDQQLRFIGPAWQVLIVQRNEIGGSPGERVNTVSVAYN
jgi:hypothetical protein